MMTRSTVTMGGETPAVGGDIQRWGAERSKHTGMHTSVQVKDVTKQEPWIVNSKLRHTQPAVPCSAAAVIGVAVVGGGPIAASSALSTSARYGRWAASAAA